MSQLPPDHPRAALKEAERLLAEAGVPSPRADAELLVAHVMGLSRAQLLTCSGMSAEQQTRLQQLLSQRAQRVPLQYLTASAHFADLTLRVGPGVFIPRPETELLLEWGMGRIRGQEQPTIVDLCSGSGALALGLAHGRPDSVVHAVEQSKAAMRWLRSNVDALGGSHQGKAIQKAMRLHHADIADPELLPDVAGEVDLVVCNPPYVPEGTAVAPEVAEYDPPEAVFAGPDGLAVIPDAIATARRLLRSGGGLALEHDETHGAAVQKLLAETGGFTDLQQHSDLTGRPRFVTARAV